MRNLFLRIFLSFWTSMTLVAVLTVMVTLWLANERVQREQERQDEFARQASRVLASEGVGGLRHWLVEQLPAVWPDRLFVLDHRGMDLLGQAVPEFLQASIGRRPFPNRGKGDDARSFRLLSQLQTTGGDTYALSLLRQSQGGLFGLFGAPDTVIVGGIATLLVSAIVCFLLARFISAPIGHLRAATRSIASGNLSVRVADMLGRRRDELAMLAVDFDSMAERLRTLLESQRQLLRDVSHELRSPLARLQIALGLARRPAANLEQEFDRIEQETRRLEELIAEILSLTRLDDPARAIETEEVAVDELLDLIAENARLEADALKVRVDVQMSPGLMVQGDRELLFRALENVVRNAVRFSPSGAVVRISAQPQGDQAVQLSVCDRGPGVSAEYLEKIFEPFCRVGDARDRDSGGHGIGLAITSRVVGLHGGTVRAANLAGGGLDVTITLPRAPSPPDHATPQQPPRGA